MITVHGLMPLMLFSLQKYKRTYVSYLSYIHDHRCKTVDFLTTGMFVIKHN